jgi:hypothetical protein
MGLRILARTPTLRYSPAIAVVLALALTSVLGPKLLVRAANKTADAIRDLPSAVEPAVFAGGIVVSRSRHAIAGGIMGCGAGAGVGAGSAAVFGMASGGLGMAAVPAAAAIGCGVGAAGGIAVGYPLDEWVLTIE